MSIGNSTKTGQIAKAVLIPSIGEKESIGFPTKEFIKHTITDKSLSPTTKARYIMAAAFTEGAIDLGLA